MPDITDTLSAPLHYFWLYRCIALQSMIYAYQFRLTVTQWQNINTCHLHVLVASF